MPYNLPIQTVTNVTSTNVTLVTGWLFEIYSENNILLGTYDLGTGVFTAGTSDVMEPLSYIYIYSVGGGSWSDLVIDDTSYFTISIYTDMEGARTLNIYFNAFTLSGSTTPAETKTVYPAYTGTVWDEVELLTPLSFLDQSNDLITSSEDLNQEGYNEIIDYVYSSDARSLISYLVNEETINLQDIIEENIPLFISEKIKMLEETEVEEYSEYNDIQSLTDLGEVFSIFFNELIDIGDIVNYVSPETTDDINIITDIIPFQERGLKYISWVAVEYSGTSTLQIALYFRYSPDESWQVSSYVDVNKEGIARMSIAAMDFKIALKFSSKDLINDIGKIKLGFSMVDRRYTRGAIRGEIS